MATGSWAPAPLLVCWGRWDCPLPRSNSELWSLSCRPSPCLALQDWPQPAPSPWLPLLGYWWEAGHRADLANLHTEEEGRGRSQGPRGTRLFPSCPEPRAGPGVRADFSGEVPLELSLEEPLGAHLMFLLLNIRVFLLSCVFQLFL